VTWNAPPISRTVGGTPCSWVNVWMNSSTSRWRSVSRGSMDVLPPGV
jgi:hypothetical protein